MPTPQEKLLGPAAKQLRASSALIVGVGGLGCPAALYLARSVGTIGLSDFDVVSNSNLDRQILFDPQDIGKPKVEVAAKKLSWHARIQVHPDGLRGDNALQQLQGYDIVLDCSDDLATRYLIDEVAAQASMPWVHGALSTWGGHTMLLNHNHRFIDWFPQPPEDPANCADGVLSTACGLVATLQATLAIRHLSGLDSPFGMLHVVDALDGTIRTVAK